MHAIFDFIRQVKVGKRRYKLRIVGIENISKSSWFNQTKFQHEKHFNESNRWIDLPRNFYSKNIPFCSKFPYASAMNYKQNIFFFSIVLNISRYFFFFFLYIVTDKCPYNFLMWYSFRFEAVRNLFHCSSCCCCCCCYFVVLFFIITSMKLWKLYALFCWMSVSIPVRVERNGKTMQNYGKSINERDSKVRKKVHVVDENVRLVEKSPFTK